MLLATLCATLLVACRNRSSEPGAQAMLPGGTYGGSAACKPCHAEQYEAWQNSAHAFAAKHSEPALVRGTFDGGEATWGEGSKGRLETSGETLSFGTADTREGREAGHRLSIYFGNRTIEQHLAEFPGGRFQALPIGYDLARNEWFDLFPGDPRAPEDWGHWSGRGMTANSECLFCHTTGFERGYDLATDAYSTTWAELGVGCEACHGPGVDHVNTTRDGAAARQTFGLIGSDRMLDACAACHALRRELRPGFAAGNRFLDHFEPVLLDEADYEVDGQLSGEAYEWASFLQSRMYREGVTCSDCHDPHRAELRAEGNGLCLECHEPVFADVGHTHHATGSPGSRCVACHMPEKIFMARDRRRDHSFLIPDPGISVQTGTTNACQACHAERGAEWAAEQVNRWFAMRDDSADRRQLAAAVLKARHGESGAEPVLIECLRSCEASIWRATAAKLLGGFTGSPGVEQALVEAAASTDDLVRTSAVWALAEPVHPSPAASVALVAAASDPVRAVRLSAAWGLRALDPAGRLVASPPRG